MMHPPYDQIVRLEGRARPTGVVWDAFDNQGRFLLTLSRDSMEKLINHPRRAQTITIQLHDDPEGERTVVLGPETTLEVTWRDSSGAPV
jgi:hypothetical protein